MTCRICPSYTHFPPTPCFVRRVHTKPPVLERGLRSLFCVNKSTLSLEELLIASVKMSRGSSSFLYLLAHGVRLSSAPFQRGSADLTIHSIIAWARRAKRFTLRGIVGPINIHPTFYSVGLAGPKRSRF